MSSKSWPLFSVAVIGASLSFLSQINYDTWQRYSPLQLNISYNTYIEPQPLSAATARAASFGATEFMADWYWLQLIQYYGGGDPYGKYRKLAELFSTVTDLSPKFFAPYEHGLLILPGEGFVDEAIALGEKGQKNLPDRWEIPYYEGLVYHIYKKDFARAAEEFTIASKLPGAPENTKYLAAIYYNNANERQTSYLLFKSVADSTTDQFVKDRAQKYIVHLEGIFYLEDGVKAFQNKYGRLPKSYDELLTTHSIAQVPQSPLGITYGYDSSTGRILELKP